MRIAQAGRRSIWEVDEQMLNVQSLRFPHLRLRERMRDVQLIELSSASTPHFAEWIPHEVLLTLLRK